MISTISPWRLLLGSVLGTTIVNGISGENVQMIAAMASFVAAVIGGFVWLDARFDAKIRTHAKEEYGLDEAREKRLLSELKGMIAEHRAREAERELERFRSE